MITKIEKIFATESFSDIRKAYVSRARLESKSIIGSTRWLQNNGFELITEPTIGNLTADGREVIQVFDKKWALKMDIHLERRRIALDKAQEYASQKQVSNQSTAEESFVMTSCPQMIDGKPCGSALNRVTVCPSCVTGKLGYRYRYSCETCGFDIVTKQELME